jgi:hypothetical protein
MLPGCSIAAPPSAGGALPEATGPGHGWRGRQGVPRRPRASGAAPEIDLRLVTGAGGNTGLDAPAFFELLGEGLARLP